MFFKKKSASTKEEQNLKFNLEQLNNQIVDLENQRLNLIKEKKELEIEKETLNLKIKNFESAYTIKEKEATSLMKIKLEQEIARFSMEKEKEINNIKADYEKKISEFKEKEQQNYYDKLSESLEKLHREGNKTTEFMEKIALKMFDRKLLLEHKEKEDDEG